MHAERGWLAHGARMAGGGDACGAPSRTERGGGGEADGWARARKNKQIKFEIRNEGIPGLKNSPNFYWR